MTQVAIMARGDHSGIRTNPVATVIFSLKLCSTVAIQPPPNSGVN